MGNHNYHVAITFRNYPVTIVVLKLLLLGFVVLRGFLYFPFLPSAFCFFGGDGSESSRPVLDSSESDEGGEATGASLRLRRLVGIVM
jgi:hypothetical protein